MGNIQLRSFKKTDIKEFYEIIINPNFIHIVLPKSFESFERYFNKKLEKEKDKLEYNYAVIFNNELIGAGAIKINEERPYIGELTCSISEQFWGKGIATEIVKKLEEISFNKLHLTKTEIWMCTKNLASEKIAKKLGYKKEGLLKNKVKERHAELADVFIYSKINEKK